MEISVIYYVNRTLTKINDLIGDKMKIIVEVPDYDANQVAKEITAVSRGKSVTVGKAAELFAQDLINRYFSTEYLDAEKLSDN